MLGILPNALKITTEDKSNYKFTSFSKRNVAYKSFLALWKNVSSIAKDVDVDEDQPEDVDSDTEKELKYAEDQPSGDVSGGSANEETKVSLESRSQNQSFVNANRDNNNGENNKEGIMPLNYHMSSPASNDPPLTLNESARVSDAYRTFLIPTIKFICDARFLIVLNRQKLRQSKYLAMIMKLKMVENLRMIKMKSF